MDGGEVTAQRLATNVGAHTGIFFNG